MALPIIESPTFEVTIPGRNQVTTFRPFLVKEDKLLTLAAESGEHKEMVNACIQVVNNCSLENVDAREMAMYQLQWTFLEIRKRSVGELQSFSLTCGECNTVIPYELNVNEFKIEGNMTTDTKEIKISDEVSIVLKYPRCIDQDSISDMDDVEVIRSCLESINNGEETINPKDESIEALDVFIESLPVKVIQEAAEFFDSMPYLGHELTYKCKKCDKNNYILINGYEHFFG